MKKIFLAICATIFSLSCVAIPFSVTAEEKENTATLYKLSVGQYEYKTYSGDLSLWWGAPNEADAYVNDDNIVSPGKDYATAIAFTAPTDGKISPAWGLGTVKRIGKVTETSDGIRFSVFLNDTKIYPSDGLWANAPQDGDPNNNGAISYNELTLTEGDKLYYIVDNGGNGNSEWDMAYLLMGFRWESEEYPDGVWYDSDAGYYTTEESGEEACLNLTKYTKSQLTSYHYVKVKESVEKEQIETESKQVSVSVNAFEFTELNGTLLWAGAPISDGRGHCYVNGNLVVPGSDYATAICFTAPCDGRIVNSLGCGTMFRSGECTDATDGCRISVVLNNEVVYPYSGVWTDVPQGFENQSEIAFNSVDVKAGDKLYYIIDCGGNGNSEWDIVQLDAGFLWIDENNPTGIYVDFSENYWTSAQSGESSVSFGNSKKSDTFSYLYVVVDERNPIGEAQAINKNELTTELVMEKLSYSQAHNKYYKLDDANLVSYSDICQPGDYYALGIVWTAPENGRVDLSQTTVQNFYYQTQANSDGVKSDGVRMQILLNNKYRIYPTEEEWLVLNDTTIYSIDMQVLSVEKGDKFTFILENNGACNYDTCKFDITVTFAEDDAEHTATYNNITDFPRDSEHASAWTYYALNFQTSEEENERVVPELPVVPFVSGGCTSSISENIGLFVALGVISAFGITLKKKKEN